MPENSSDERVVIIAPVGQDAAVMAALLQAQGFQTVVCEGTADCHRHIPQGAGVLLLTEEALELSGAPKLFELLKGQPPWSEVPLVILTSGGESRVGKLLDLAGSAAGSVTLLERPMRSATLLRSIHVALRSRRRQYQVRELLKEQQRKRTELEAATAVVEKELAERRLAEEALGKWANKPLPQQQHSVLARYGVACLAVAIAVAIRFPLFPVLGSQVPLATLFAATAITVWYGGAGPAILTAVAGFLGLNWFLFEQPFTFTARDVSSLILYLVTSGLFIGFGLNMRRAQSHAHASARVAVERRRQMEAEIEERKRAQAEIQRTRDTLQSVLHTAPVGLAVANAAGEFQLVNDMAREIVGGEVNGTAFETRRGYQLCRLDGTQMPPAELPLPRALREAKSVGPVEVLIKRDNGSTAIVLSSATPLLDSDGKVSGATAVIQDITERKNFEKELERLVTSGQRNCAQQMSNWKPSFTQSRDDLRAPLRAMMAYAQLLVDEHRAGLDENAQQMLGRIQISSALMDKLLMDLLAFSRTARAEMQLRPVEVQKAWESALVQCAAQNEQSGGESVYRWSLPRVRAHEAILAQCLANLLGNALKFVAPGTKPIVRFWSEDSAIGSVFGWKTMASELRVSRKDFPSLERLQGTHYPGTGIGLAIVRKGVERMGGRIGLESEPAKAADFGSTAADRIRDCLAQAGCGVFSPFSKVINPVYLMHGIKEAALF